MNIIVKQQFQNVKLKKRTTNKTSLFKKNAGTPQNLQESSIIITDICLSKFTLFLNP